MRDFPEIYGGSSVSADERAPGVPITRRELLGGLGTGLAVLTVGSVWGAISPAQARAKGAPLRQLRTEEGAALEAFADVLLPGARDAGVAHYVDDQLERAQPLLFVKYLDEVESELDFYREGLASLDRASRARHGRPFAALAREAQVAFVRELLRASPEGWSGFPSPLFGFVVRNDAVDVFYGTPEGFARLGVPYAAHLEPPTKW